MLIKVKVSRVIDKTFTFVKGKTINGQPVRLMKQQKNILSLSLMISSIALLIILQFFWLQSSYEKAFSDFKRETDILFRSTVMTMRDSVLMQNIEPVSGDTLPLIHSSRFFLSHDPLHESGADSVTGYVDAKNRSAGVQIFVSSTTPDSLHRDILKPLAMKFQNVQRTRLKGLNRSFIIRLSPDTLNVDSLSVLYKAALTLANIDAPFRIRHVRVNPVDIPEAMTELDGPDFLRRAERLHTPPTLKMNIFSDTITSAIRINPLNRYSASLTGVRSVVLKEITPQILFTLFLTFTTVTAFVLMYRNQRTQQRLMEAKNDFINNVTHELRTPVATVSVALEALKNFKAMDNPRLTQEYLDIAQHELLRLSMIADKILKTSVLENKGFEFNAEKIDLDMLVQQILKSMKLVFEKKNAVLKYEKTSATSPVWGGAVHMMGMITNLIDNALKYSAHSPVVSITLRETDDAVTLSVKDQGIGIDPEYHGKIFEKFFRVPTGDVHNTKGYGLGLSYVASVVKSHGGNIKVNSKLGEGSEFVITLPKTPPSNLS